LIRAVREGIPYVQFRNLVKSIPMTYEDWSLVLHISERTLQRYKKENRVFDPVESEKILRIIMLFNFGKQLFGSVKDFNSWLNTENVAMGGIRPREILDTTFGIDWIKDELVRIEQGVMS